MSRVGARMAAELIFAVHTVQILVALFGWLLPPPYYYIYLADISIAFIVQIIWRSCFLTTWEFYFRKVLDPSIDGTEHYLTFYTHKFFPKVVTNRFVDRISLIFLALSIAFAALHLSGNL